jgi:gamma-glutamyl-gamma-aminobutyraldehyde dehydrogenase
MTDSAVVFPAAPEEKKMLDRPNCKEVWLARAAALKPEGRAFIDGAYVGALSGKTFAKTSPVVVVIAFEDEAEAIRLANDTIHGLGAAVWTSDMNAAHRLTRAIRAGTVWVNAYDRSSLTTPFGGFKQSGFGGDRSPRAVEKYMDFKTIWTAYR